MRQDSGLKTRPISRRPRRLFISAIVAAALFSGLPARGQGRIDPTLAPEPIRPTRTLFIFPGVNTVKDPDAVVPPLTKKQKYQIFWRRTFDRSLPLEALFFAGISQSINYSPRYGQGWGPFAERFGSYSGSIASTTFFSDAFLPSLLHQDPATSAKAADHSDRACYIRWNPRSSPIPTRSNDSQHLRAAWLWNVHRAFQCLGSAPQHNPRQHHAASGGQVRDQLEPESLSRVWRLYSSQAGDLRFTLMPLRSRALPEIDGPGVNAIDFRHEASRRPSPPQRTSSSCAGVALEIRRAAELSAADRDQKLRSLAESVLRFWDESGQTHFTEEEQVLLPKYARHFRLDEDPEIMRMLADHAAIRARMEDVRETLGGAFLPSPSLRWAVCFATTFGWKKIVSSLESKRR